MQPATSQPRVDKALARVAQPLARHYNGQGLVRASTYVPLSSDGFDGTFESLWKEHVDFGTSRAHKKLGKRQRAKQDQGSTAGGEASCSAGGAEPAAKLSLGRSLHGVSLPQPAAAAVRP